MRWNFFIEKYKKDEFEKAGIKENFAQDNHSKSKGKVVRRFYF